MQPACEEQGSGISNRIPAITSGRLLVKKGIMMDKKTITGWSIAVTWSDGKRENILDIPDEVAQYIDDYITEIEEHGDLAKPSTELVREI